MLISGLGFTGLPVLGVGTGGLRFRTGFPVGRGLRAVGGPATRRTLPKKVPIHLNHHPLTPMTS